MDQSKKSEHKFISNSYLDEIDQDFMYHLGLDTKNFNLIEMFGDVKFVVMGGSSKRMKKFAYYVKELLLIKFPVGCNLENITKEANRYSLFKIGPVLSVSHGIGSASLSILLHELFKLLFYAKCKDVIFLRIGTCGLIGHKEGTLVVSNKTYNSQLEPYFKRNFLDKSIKICTLFNQDIVQNFKEIAEKELADFNFVSGGTLTTNDFYEEQGRLDGAFCRFTKEERDEFFNKLQSIGIVNIEMEANTFAAYCIESNLKFAIVCVGLLDRLKKDQISLDEEQYSNCINNLFKFVGSFIINNLHNV